MHWRLLRLPDANYGIEFEMSDINVQQAAEIVWSEQDLDIRDWHDRGLDFSIFTKVRRYDIWNISSDPTIHNSDGSRSMRGKREDWKGAELISPVLNTRNMGHDIRQLALQLDRLCRAGANVDPATQGLHVHVDVSDWELSDAKKFVEWMQSIQPDLIDSLRRLGRKRQHAWKVRPSQSMLRSTSLEQMFEAYRSHQYVKGQVAKPEHYGYRRLVCIAPFLNDQIPFKTIEWRCWPATWSIRQIEKFVALSAWGTRTLPEPNEFLVMLEECI